MAKPPERFIVGQRVEHFYSVLEARWPRQWVPAVVDSPLREMGKGSGHWLFGVRNEGGGGAYAISVDEDGWPISGSVRVAYPTPWQATSHKMSARTYAGVIEREQEETRHNSKRCEHRHRSREAAQRCAETMLKAELDPQELEGLPCPAPR